MVDVQGLTGSARIEQLAQPKRSHKYWSTEFGVRRRWGNQDPIEDIPAPALKAVATPRVSQLATPKKNFRPEELYINHFLHSCGRSSPTWDVSDAAQKCECSARVAGLAAAKPFHPSHNPNRKAFENGSCGRVSPLWDVSAAAQKGSASARVEQLAQPRPLPKLHRMGHSSVQRPVPIEALTAKLTARLDQLATPKERLLGDFREAEWKVSKGAKSYSTSVRTMELSKPNSLAEGFVPQRDCVWPVSVAARHAIAGPRLESLAQSIDRPSMELAQFNPLAFVVSDAAKRAKCSPRIEELAQPRIYK